MEKQALIDYFNGCAADWQSTCPPEKLRCILTLCDIQPDCRVLDMGCGTGTLEPLLLEYDVKSVCAVDFSDAMLTRAKAFCSDERVEYLCQDVMELSAIGEYDLVVAQDIFPCFDNRGSLIRQVHRLLTPGGRLMLCHTTGRTLVNAGTEHGGAPGVPLSAASTLAKTLSPSFDVDILVDTPALYVVSGVACAR